MSDEVAQPLAFFSALPPGAPRPGKDQMAEGVVTKAAREFTWEDAAWSFPVKSIKPRRAEPYAR